MLNRNDTTQVFALQSHLQREVSWPVARAAIRAPMSAVPAHTAHAHPAREAFSPAALRGPSKPRCRGLARGS